MALIVCDLDRTLLRDDKTVSSYSLEVLRRCMERGDRAAIATARPWRTVEPYWALLNWDGAVAGNGAAVRAGEEWHFRTIRREDAREVLDSLLGKVPGRISAEVGETYCENYFLTPERPRLPEGEVFKIIVEYTTLETLQKVMDCLPAPLYCSVSDGKLIQVMSREATKWRGIQILLDRFHMGAQDVLYFGDDFDDLEPMRLSGRGVAVANALPKVLEAADDVTDSNQEDGVARYLERRLL